MTRGSAESISTSVVTSSVTAVLPSTAGSPVQEFDDFDEGEESFDSEEEADAFEDEGDVYGRDLMRGKIESITSEYNRLLNTQLQAQCVFFEQRMVSADQETVNAIAAAQGSVHALTEQLHRVQQVRHETQHYLPEFLHLIGFYGRLSGIRGS